MFDPEIAKGTLEILNPASMLRWSHSITCLTAASLASHRS